MVQSIAVGASGVYAGGSLDAIANVSRTNFAAFPITAIEWGGISGGSWNQASNWAPGIVPGSTIAHLGQRANALKSILSFVSKNCIDQLNSAFNLWNVKIHASVSHSSWPFCCAVPWRGFRR
jgi:hypothetical protein